jgi:hypothetical protein
VGPRLLPRHPTRRPGPLQLGRMAGVPQAVIRFRQEKGIGPRGFSRWIQPEMKKYLLACCDCSLVHEMQFRIAGDKVQFRARRAERHTAQQRKLKR